MLNRLSVKSSIARVFGTIRPAAVRPLAVLTYHSVGSPVAGSTPAALFERHLQQLVSFPDMPCLDWRRKKDCSALERACLITFDDGYLDNFTEAAPLLERYGIRALFFITTAFIERSLDITQTFRSYKGLAPMSWDQIGALIERGHSIGMHGHKHRNLGGMSLIEAVDEFERSREMFRRRLGAIPDSFAYPYGQFHHRRADFALLAGISPPRYVFTMDHRLAGMDDLSMPKSYRLIPRLRVDAQDSAAVVGQKVHGDWDYVAGVQRLKSCIAMRSLAPLILNDR
jgi:peptidoglycan/xylan/chitin deacetylase (PgdA/CDA1 family)